MRLLLRLIQSFNERDLAAAQQWLDSPAHNQREVARRCFALLAEHCHQLDTLPHKEWVYARLFPNQPYDDQRFRLLCSYVLRQLEDWLTWQQWQQDLASSPPDLWLLAAYQQRGLSDLFEQRLKRAWRRLDKSPFRHPDHYLQRYQLAREAYRHEVAGERGPLNLQDQDNTLTALLLALKLRQACWAQAHQQVYPTQYHIALLEPVLELAHTQPYRDLPAIAVYRQAYLAYLAPQEEGRFVEFRQTLFLYWGHFPTPEQRDLLLLAINFCIRRINQGNEPFLREAFVLYQRGLEADLLLENGRLSPFTYNNITGIGLRLAELAWTELFVARYRTRLEPRHQETLFALNAARLAYAQKRPDLVLQHLQRADYRDDFIHAMSARILLLKVYYETGEWEVLSTHLKNTRAYLRHHRTEVSYHEQNYLHILQLTEALLRLNPYDRQAAGKLRERILATDPLTERAWLLAQLATP